MPKNDTAWDSAGPSPQRLDQWIRAKSNEDPNNSKSEGPGYTCTNNPRLHHKEEGSSPRSHTHTQIVFTRFHKPETKHTPIKMN